MEFLIGLGIGILGIIVTIVIAIYQERSPNIEVSAYSISGGIPNTIECKVTNSGKKQAENLYIGFNRVLPVETVVRADPEIGAELIEAEFLPDPQSKPNEALLLKAFTIKIPRVAAKDTITFQVTTINSDNERAAEQVVKIRKEIFSVISDFINKVQNKYPDVTANLHIDTLKAARIKQENFFTPGKFSYERGRFPITFLSEDEERTIAINQDIYTAYKKEFIDVFKDRPEFKAPVLRIKTSGGESTLGIFPPYISTYIEFQASMKELREQQWLMVPPPIPSSYK